MDEVRSVMQKSASAPEFRDMLLQSAGRYKRPGEEPKERHEIGLARAIGTNQNRQWTRFEIPQFSNRLKTAQTNFFQMGAHEFLNCVPTPVTAASRLSWYGVGRWHERTSERDSDVPGPYCRRSVAEVGDLRRSCPNPSFRLNFASQLDQSEAAPRGFTKPSKSSS